MIGNSPATDHVGCCGAAIKSRELSKISPMPVGLLNTFTQDEILDLFAFLESQGDPNHPNFRR